MDLGEVLFRYLFYDMIEHLGFDVLGYLNYNGLGRSLIK